MWAFLRSRAMGLFPLYYLAMLLHLPRVLLKRRLQPTKAHRLRGTLDDLLYMGLALQVGHRMHACMNPCPPAH